MCAFVGAKILIWHIVCVEMHTSAFMTIH